jgi:hypothetical protein
MDPDSTAATVQPGEGEGGAGDQQANGTPQGELFDLDSVPEELRPYVEDVLKQVQGNVTQRFQEHADFRKQWEPYSQIEGLSDVPAEDLQQLLEFHRLAQDPEQFGDWVGEWLQAYREHAPEQFNALADKLDQAGLFDGEGDPDEGEEPEGGDDLRSILNEALDQRLGPIEQFIESQQDQSEIGQIEQALVAEADEVKAQHREQFGEELDDEAVEAIGKLSHAYDEAQGSIKSAYQDYLRLTGKAQGDLVDEKLGQPAAAVAGGQADTTPERASFIGGNGANPKELARARMRAG